MKEKISLDKLKSLLHYDPLTGEFTRIARTSSRTKVGQRAGRPTSTGYWRISLDRVDYKAHRLAWFYVYGVWPSGHIDHINRDKRDNRISNLRDVTESENRQNVLLRADNKSGFKGVHFSSRRQRWVAQISHMRRGKNLGAFPTAELAYEAYRKAAAVIHAYNPVAAEL
jgi:hypothetical protein